MAQNICFALGLTGGGATDLDKINSQGDNNVDGGDFCVVMDLDSYQSRHFYYNSSGSDSEDSPCIIVPDDRSVTGQWEEMPPAVGLKEHPSNSTLTHFDFGIGKEHTNNGSSGTVTLTIPSLATMGSIGKLGCEAIFYCMENELFEVAPNVSDQCFWDGVTSVAGDKVYSSVKGSIWRMKATVDFWLILGVEGDVYFET